MHRDIIIPLFKWEVEIRKREPARLGAGGFNFPAADAFISTAQLLHFLSDTIFCQEELDSPVLKKAIGKGFRCLCLLTTA